MSGPPEGAPVVAPARVAYADDQPYSLDYGDIYHAADGAAEVQRVFIAPCALEALAERRARRPGPLDTVRIGELGFGSGLNFVVAAERVLAAGARLHFVSCEAHPIDRAELAAIARARSGTQPLYRELAASYPHRVGGWHQRVLAGGRIRLNLWLGSADDALADLAGRQRQPFDAWFLDGFAPDRNASMWKPDLLGRLGTLSGPGTRVATFTAAGRVRRALEAAGFAMERVDQRPHKRETLAGTFAGRGLQGFPAPAEVTVVGAGLAGTSAAWQLARAGCRVTMLDARPAADDPKEAESASALPATVLHARLLEGDTPTAALRCLAYLHASALHAGAVAAGLPGFRSTGVLQLDADSGDPHRSLRLAARYGPSGPWIQHVEAAEAGRHADWPVPGGGLYLPDAGVVELPALLAAMSAHEGVTRVEARVEDLPAERPLVLACGAAVRDFAACRHLELAAVHGQLDVVAVERAPALPLVGRGYLVPVHGGTVAAGTTYEHRPWDPEQATCANLAQLEGIDYRWCYRRRGVRAVSSDRTAVAGPVYDPQQRVLDGLYVSTGHGSAGNVSAHLAAAVLTARILGDCPPLSRSLEAALSPLRFRERQARRGYRHGAEP